MRRSPVITLSALALTATLVLSACSSDSTETDDSGAETQAEAPGTFNDADVAFATDMIPHHEQAVDMSAMAQERGGPEVVDLADRIEAAQDPEIETMTGWLQDWGVDVPTGMGSMADMDMMDPSDMEDIMGAEGAQFDTVWLEMMIEHHEGAIAMAQVEKAEGVNPEAVELAATIIEAQQAEIVEMEQMLELDQ